MLLDKSARNKRGDLFLEYALLSYIYKFKIFKIQIGQEERKKKLYVSNMSISKLLKISFIVIY